MIGSWHCRVWPSVMRRDYGMYTFNVAISDVLDDIPILEILDAHMLVSYHLVQCWAWGCTIQEKYFKLKHLFQLSNHFKFLRRARRKVFNHLRVKCLRENINIYLHFMSFLRTNRTQVVEIPPRVRQGPAYSTLSISWLLMSWRRKEPGHQQPWYWPS